MSLNCSKDPDCTQQQQQQQQSNHASSSHVVLNQLSFHVATSDPLQDQQSTPQLQRLRRWIRYHQQHAAKIPVEQKYLLSQLGFCWSEAEVVAAALGMDWQEEQVQFKNGDLANDDEDDDVINVEDSDSASFGWNEKDDNTAEDGPQRRKGYDQTETPHNVKAWFEKYEQLMDYYSEHGRGTEVKWKVGDNIDLQLRSLYDWSLRQRNKLVKENSLSVERERLLNDIGFVWDPKSPTNTQRKTRTLQQYYDDDGGADDEDSDSDSDTDATGSVHHDESNGAPVDGQQNDDPSSNSSLLFVPDSHFPDVTYSKLNNDAWHEQYQELKEFYAEHRTTTVPSTGDRRLHDWAHRQKVAYHNRKLGRDRKVLLDELGFQWTTFSGRVPKTAARKSPNKKEAEEDDNVVFFGGADDHGGESEFNESSGEDSSVVIPTARSKANEKYKSKAKDSGLTESWLRNYKMLRRVYRKRGGAFEIRSREKKLRFLYQWVWRQRHMYKKTKKLSWEKKQLLDAIGVDFLTGEGSNNYADGKAEESKEDKQEESAKSSEEENTGSSEDEESDDDSSRTSSDASDAPPRIDHTQGPNNKFHKIWMKSYRDLKRYYRIHGNLRVPRSRKNKKNSSLYRWITRQRYCYRRNRINDTRIQLLNDLNFDWDPPQSTGIAWGNGGGDDGSDDESSGSVSGDQSSQSESDSSSGDVAQSRGFTKGGRYEQLWLGKFEELKRFKKKNGHVNVLSSSQNAGLYSWIYRQRVFWKTNKMPRDRKTMLDGIGFDWEPGKSDDEDKGDKGNEIVDDEESSKGSESDSSTGSVIEESRKRKFESADRFEQLWMENYESFKAMTENHGSQVIPYGRTKDRFLYHWSWRQRKKMRQNKLHPRYKKLLDEINFDWDGSNGQAATPKASNRGSRRSSRFTRDSGDESGKAEHNESDGESQRQNKKKKHKRSRLSVPLAEVEDRQNILDSLDYQINTKTAELENLEDVAARIRCLLEVSERQTRKVTNESA